MFPKKLSSPGRSSEERAAPLLEDADDATVILSEAESKDPVLRGRRRYQKAGSLDFARDDKQVSAGARPGSR